MLTNFIALAGKINLSPPTKFWCIGVHGRREPGLVLTLSFFQGDSLDVPSRSASSQITSPVVGTFSALTPADSK